MKKAQAFTLTELLIAVAITTLLVVLLANVVAAAINIWGQGINRVDTLGNARTLVSRIADELGGAIVIKDRLQFVENKTFGGGPTPTAGTSESVFFIAPYPNADSGDACVVAYGHNRSTYQLQRAFLASDSAWNGSASHQYLETNYKTLEWKTVAEGIIEFELRCYSQDDLDKGNNPSSTTSWDSQAAGNIAMEGKAPRRIVVRIKAIDDRSLARLRGLNAGSAPYNRLLQQSAREFFADLSLQGRREAL